MKTDIKETPQNIFIGVSWPYANGNIHLGHLAGQNLACDVFARYHRLRGRDVLMVSGSDSHGAPVIFKAEELGISPKELAEKSHKEIVDTFEKLNLVYENYTKTTTKNHREVVQNMFSVLNELGYLEIKKSKQYYDPKVERFLPDRYVRGTCPECSATNARGDECPECGKYLNPEDLIDPYSTLSDAKPVMKQTEHFYLNLKSVQKPIEKWVKEKDENWRKWVREFTRGWLKQGLEARSVTRDLSFGIPVPVKGWEDRVIYVWIEALVGYLSAAIEWANDQKNPSLWEEFWKDEKCRHYYFIAGGNVPFHTIMWPAEITAYNEKYKNEELSEKYKLPGESSDKPLNLPFDVPANKMLFFKGRKMSKGDGTGITVEDLLEKYNPDVIRYFFIKYAPENHDREYTWKDFIDANNNELVANIGNFINRSLTFTNTKFDGTVPEGDLAEEVKIAIEKAFKETSKSLEKAEFVKAIECILELGHFANKYFNDKEPWATVKTDIEQAQQTIYNTLQLVNALRILLKPFLPQSSDKLAVMLNIKDEYDPTVEVAKSGRVSKYVDQFEFSKLEQGLKLGKSEILFEKLEYTEEMEQQDGGEGIEDMGEIGFEQEPKLNEIPVITEVFTDLKISAKSKKVSEWIKDIEKRVVEKYGEDKKWSERGEFEGYVELHSQYSSDKFEPAPQKLVRFILEKGKLPNINTFVDIYNAVSALTGVSIGAHDISKLKGTPRMVELEEDTKFAPITGERGGVAKKGEYAYTDDGGILCRLDIKQGVRTKVTNKTRSILIILQGHSSITKEDLENALNLLREGIELIQVSN